MKWSKQKKLLESLLADSVKDRLKFHITRYGPGFSTHMMRAWVTWDGSELVNFSNAEWYGDRYEIKEQLIKINGHVKLPAPDHPRGYITAYDQANEILNKQHRHSRDELVYAIEEHCTLSIEAALESEDPIIRALAIVDRRVGKRRLAKIDMMEVEHPLVRQFYTLRCEAEGLNAPLLAASQTRDQA